MSTCTFVIPRGIVNSLMSRMQETKQVAWLAGYVMKGVPTLLASTCSLAMVCRKLFAEMEMSVKAFADPAAFASSLQLDNTIQQADS